MLVTSLNPYIGYDKASQCAKYAFKENTTLKEAVLHFGYLTESEFDQIIDPKKMVQIIFYKGDRKNIMETKQGYRVEHDCIGESLIPENAYYGIHTQRATENFKITRRKTNPEMIK